MTIYTRPAVRFGPVRINLSTQRGYRRPPRTDRVQRIGNARSVARGRRWRIILTALAVPLLVVAAGLLAAALVLVAVVAVSTSQWDSFADSLSSAYRTARLRWSYLHTAANGE
ncbi:hypothetical protein [Nocardia acidivorans]|uniref:hypothetical protein n=1 Tax=Nocardia acidivorans TaxID=404580 RepID=UPI000834B79D|nr:hypothetical protein [Nocardia acidivorans]